MGSSIQPVAYDPTIQSLLLASGLPTDDLASPSNVLLFGSFVRESLVGVVGLEVYQPHALLRSLAVTNSNRGNGIGVAMVEFAESYAQEIGVTTVWLLTTTATKFFERRGYTHASRDSVPESIAGTRQFSGLCPTSSAFMVKRQDG